MDRIKVYGTQWCRDTILARKVLDERGTSYEWIDINQDPDAERIVKDTNHGNRNVPMIVFTDNSILVEPSREELEEKLTELDL